jgi:hypothetical protein
VAGSDDLIQLKREMTVLLEQEAILASVASTLPNQSNKVGLHAL